MTTQQRFNEDYIYVTDNGGNRMKLVEFCGRYHPRYHLHQLKHAMEIHARPDDTLLVAYSKAGTHWTFEVLRLLEAGTVDIPRIEKEQYMIELRDPSHIDGLPSPRTLNSHFHAEEISPDFMVKKCKTIHVTRDPRDIVVSFYLHHLKMKTLYDYEGEFKDFLQLFLESKVDNGSWFEYTKSWEKTIQAHHNNPILVLSYELMKKNPIDNIRRISEFMGYKHNEEFLEQVADKTSIETMKKERNNPGDKLGQTMYRKGIVGDWKNWFTVTQSEMFNEVFEKEMKGTQAYQLYSHNITNGTDNGVKGNRF